MEWEGVEESDVLMLMLCPVSCAQGDDDDGDTRRRTTTRLGGHESACNPDDCCHGLRPTVISIPPCRPEPGECLRQHWNSVSR